MESERFDFSKLKPISMEEVMAVQQQTFDATGDEWEIPSIEESNGDFEVIDQGMYALELIDVSELQPQKPEFDPTGKKKQFTATWAVVDDEEWDGYEIKSWYTLSLNEKSNLFQVVKAIFGGKLDPSLRLKPSMLLGKRIRAWVDVPPPTAEQEANGRTHGWPKVKNPVPYELERKGRKKKTDHGSVENIDVADVRNNEDVGDEQVPF